MAFGVSSPRRRTAHALALALAWWCLALARADEVGGIGGSSGSGDADDDDAASGGLEGDDDDGNDKTASNACSGCRGPRTYDALLHELLRDYDPAMRPSLSANCTGRPPAEHVFVSFEACIVEQRGGVCVCVCARGCVSSLAQLSGESARRRERMTAWAPSPL